MGKQYAILRVQKCKGAEIGAMQYHNDREPGKHTNPDIDQSRTRLNREMCPHADYEGEELREQKAALIDEIAYKDGQLYGLQDAVVSKELGALAAEAQQMRKSGKQLESERASGRPESRSKGVDR